MAIYSFFGQHGTEWGLLFAAMIIALVPVVALFGAARHADPRTTTIYDHRRQNYDRHAAYAVVAYVTGG